MSMFFGRRAKMLQILISFLVPGCTGNGGGQEASSPPVVYTDLSWSQPEPVSSQDRAKILRYPSIATTKAGFVTAGYGIRFFDNTEVDGRSFVLVGEDGVVIPSPPGDWQFLHALIAYSGNGTLHLLWGETTKDRRLRKGTDWPPTRIAELWQSSRGVTGAWTTPTQLIRAETIDWNTVYRGTVQMTPSGPAGLSILVTGLPFGRVVRGLVLTDSSWLLLPGERQDFKGIFPLGTDAMWINDRLHAVVQGMSTIESQTPVVVAMSRNRVDATWSGQQLIAGLEIGTQLMDLRLTSAGEHSLVAVWTQQLRGRYMIGIAKRDLRAESWELEPSLEVPFFPVNLRIAPDSSRLLRVVYQPLGPPGKTYYVEFMDAWSQPREVLNGYDAADIALTKTSDGIPLLFFTQTRGDKIQTYFSRWKK